MKASVLIPGGIAEDQRFQPVGVAGSVSCRNLTELIPSEEEEPPRRRSFNDCVDIQAVVLARVTLRKSSRGQSLTTSIEMNQLKS